MIARMIAAVVMLSAIGCTAFVEPSDEFICGPEDSELLTRMGVAGLPPSGPRRVKIVLEASMSPETQVMWVEAVEDWRIAVADSCPFEPEFVLGKTSSILGYVGTTRDSPAKDTVELRVDPVQPNDMSGNGWSWAQCRSGRATLREDADDLHRVTRHELGHALGALPHDNTGETTIMANAGENWWKVDDVMPADVANYARIWCPSRKQAASE